MFTYDETATVDPAAAGRGGPWRRPPEKPLKRDTLGNALGGIRLAEIAVPSRRRARNCAASAARLPFDAATLNQLYPTHADYVAKVTKVSQDLVKAGFLLPAERRRRSPRRADRSMDRSSRADRSARTFASFRPTPRRCCWPTRRVSRDQDGDALVKIVDGATKAIAEGYTLGRTRAPNRNSRPPQRCLQAYVDKVQASRTRGNMPVETETLLVDQAKTLIEALRKLST